MVGTPACQCKDWERKRWRRRVVVGSYSPFSFEGQLPGWRFFDISLTPPNMENGTLLPQLSTISDKASYNVIEDLLYTINHLFICCFWDFLFTLEFHQFSFGKTICGFFQAYSTWDLLIIFNLLVILFSSSWKFFCHYFFKYSFSPFYFLFSLGESLL